MTEEEKAFRVLAGQRVCPHCKLPATDKDEINDALTRQHRWTVVCWQCYDLVTDTEFVAYADARRKSPFSKPA